MRADDPASLVPLACELGVDLVVVGPEAPLVAGLADMLRRRGVAVFGPGAEAARIEGSKAFAKDVMDAAGVPTAQTLAVARPPCVVKADGLAAGKGVWVCRTQAELDAGLRAAEALGQPFHVEELLEGEEVSIFALCRRPPRGAAAGGAGLQADRRRRRGREHRRHGRVLAGAAARPTTEIAELVETVHVPVARRARPARGAVRRRPLRRASCSPTTARACSSSTAASAIPRRSRSLPRLEGDLLAALAAAAHGDLAGVELPASEQAAVTIVLASRDYPERGDAGTPIDGVEDAEATGALVFHAGTALHEDAARHERRPRAQRHRARRLARRGA